MVYQTITEACMNVIDIQNKLTNRGMIRGVILEWDDIQDVKKLFQPAAAATILEMLEDENDISNDK